ncbi:hypothetical protein AgCh_028673 [Apium graveolens]
MLDATSGGVLWAKSYEESYELTEMMATNEYQNPTQRLPQGKVEGILELDTTMAITAQLKALTMKRSQQPVPATYHPNNRNHPNFSWSNNHGGTLSSDTKVNRGKREVKEQLKAITLRSGKVASPQNYQNEYSEIFLQKEGAPAPLPVSESEKFDKKADLKDGEAEKKKISTENTTRELNTGDKQVFLPPPYPKRLQKQKFDKQFAKFSEVFKKLHINIPFAEALEQMSSYAKFMKGILSWKLKLEELKTIALTEECNVMLQQKLPPKLKDPESFTISCTIGNLSFDKCLCDLGVSINLMPLSVFKKLGLPNPKPVNMSLQLADRSITYPRGVVEDVLVKVDKLIFPADFVILDFEEDKKISIILGRPFLATGNGLDVDVYVRRSYKFAYSDCIEMGLVASLPEPPDPNELYPRQSRRQGFTSESPILRLIVGTSSVVYSILYGLTAKKSQWLGAITSAAVIILDWNMGACLYAFQLLHTRVAALLVAGASRVFLICFGVHYWYLGHCVSYVVIAYMLLGDDVSRYLSVTRARATGFEKRMLRGGKQSSLRKALGALKDTTTVGLAILAKVHSGYKATNHEELPSKEKYIRGTLPLKSRDSLFTRSNMHGSTVPLKFQRKPKQSNTKRSLSVCAEYGKVDLP